MTMWRRLYARIKQSRADSTDHSQDKKPLEEERMPDHPRSWYPVFIGEIFVDRYKVLGKLGRGATSTVWFCEDLKSGDFKALKIGIHSLGHNPEEKLAHDAIRNTATDYPGKGCLHLHEHDFQITGRFGNAHHAFVSEPAACNVNQILREGALPLESIKVIMRSTLAALDFLHTEVRCVHGDVKADNILIRLDDRKMLDDLARSLEEKAPVSRGSWKKGTLVHKSSGFENLGRQGWNTPALGDLGIARLLGDKDDFDPDSSIGADITRAPENALMMRWGCPVDIWQASCLFYDLVTTDHLFGRLPGTDKLSRMGLLTQTIAMIGPPSVEFVSRSDIAGKFFSPRGGAGCHVRLSLCKDLEQKFANVEGEEKEAMMDFIRGMLKWNPEERMTAKELLEHQFLRSEEDRDGDVESVKEADGSDEAA